MIETTESLRRIVGQARESGVVAIDTEFVWERTYYPQLGVIQICDAEGNAHLIDPTAIDSLEPLAELIADRTVQKVLHDAQQDLTILVRHTGEAPQNVMDTQTAAGFAGLGSTLSLGNLVKKLLKVDLSKTESRTDWLRRPLTQRQREYALDDVRYLVQSADRLHERTEALRTRQWMLSEMNRFDDAQSYAEREPYDAFERVKGRQRLSGRARAVLRELAAAREKVARRLDKPRGHVVEDDVLVKMASRAVDTKFDAESVLRVGRRVHKGFLEAAGSALERASAADPLPSAARLTRSQEEKLSARTDFLLAFIKGSCIDRSIDPRLVCSRADLRNFLLGEFEKPHPLEAGWRREFVGDTLVALLAGEIAVTLAPETGLPLALPK